MIFQFYCKKGTKVHPVHIFIRNIFCNFILSPLTLCYVMMKHLFLHKIPTLPQPHTHTHTQPQKNPRLIGPLLIGYLEEDKKSTIYEDNAPSSPVLPPSLLQSTSSCSMSSSSSVSSTEEEAKLEFSSPSPRPKPNRALSDLLPPAKDGEEEEDDLNPWEK